MDPSGSNCGNVNVPLEEICCAIFSRPAIGLRMEITLERCCTDT